MQAQPQKEHEWLQQLVGDWTYESECVMGPDQPPVKFSGTETVRSIGGLWFIGEGQGEMPGGGTATMQITLGYDPQKQRYVGTWLGSMMTNLWIYDGSMDDSGKVLTLASDGPSFTNPGKLGKFRDVIEIKSADHRILTSHFLSEDGKWHQFMTAHYRRTA